MRWGGGSNVAGEWLSTVATNPLACQGIGSLWFAHMSPLTRRGVKQSSFTRRFVEELPMS